MMVSQTAKKSKPQSTIWQRLTDRQIELLIELLRTCDRQEQAEVLAAVANAKPICGPDNV